MREYYQKNRERIIEKNKEWVERNPIRVKLLKKRWANHNRDKIREANRKWKERNPDKFKESQRKYHKTEKGKERVRKYYQKNRKKILKRAFESYHKGRDMKMKSKKILSKELVLEHCQTNPQKTFSIHDIASSLKRDGIKGFSTQSLGFHLGRLAKEDGKLRKVSLGRYECAYNLTRERPPIPKINKDKISLAELGKSIVAYIELLKQENRELKKLVSVNDVVNIRELVGS